MKTVISLSATNESLLFKEQILNLSQYKKAAEAKEKIAELTVVIADSIASLEKKYGTRNARIARALLHEHK